MLLKTEWLDSNLYFENSTLHKQFIRQFDSFKDSVKID